MGESKLRVNIARFAMENVGIWEQEGREKKKEDNFTGLHTDRDKGNQTFYNSFVHERENNQRYV
ncbi:hypothetical protein Hanom_Chr13g01194641 [Helianthus anomalus]